MMAGLSLAEMIAQTDAGQDYVAWSRAHRRALQRGDALVVRHSALMANRAYTEMQREVRPETLRVRRAEEGGERR